MEQKQLEIQRLAKECSKLERRLNKLRSAIEPFLSGLQQTVKSPTYLMKVDCSAVERLVKIYHMTGEENAE